MEFNIVLVLLPRRCQYIGHTPFTDVDRLVMNGKAFARKRLRPNKPVFQRLSRAVSPTQNSCRDRGINK